MNIEQLFKDLQRQLQEHQDTTQPYLYSLRLEKKYNPNYKDEVPCRCGHSYNKHFDSYENMEAVGCKYCDCYEYIPETRDDFTRNFEYLESQKADFIIEDSRILVQLIHQSDIIRLGSDIIDVTDWELDKVISYFRNYNLWK